MATVRSNSLEKITIIGQGMDDLGQRYIKLKVAGSKIDLPPYSMADLFDPKRRLYPELGNAGCGVFAHRSQTALLNMLENYEHDGPPDFLVVPRLGSFGNYYVRPISTLGKPTQRIERALGNLDPHMLQKYRWRGSLRQWQEQIGALCTGNSRLMFAASLACTGPILSFVDGPRNGGFQITGPAETGKTTAAMVAGSIWGCHRDSARADKGFAESWNTTLNKLDETAQAHCDALLILDETALAGTDDKSRADAVLTGTFRLSEGGKKMRFNEPETAAWRLYFLSTSNLTLDELAVAGRVPIDDQHRGRLIDVVLPTGTNALGIYEYLHGFADGAAMTDAIKERCRTTFGAPGYRLVRRIYKNQLTLSATKKFVAERRDVYIKLARRRALKNGVRPLERATARFATVYAAGGLAIHHKIFKWSRTDLLRAVLACQFDGPGISSNPPPTPLRSRVTEYCANNREQFWNLDQAKLSRKRHVFGSVPGYSHTFKGSAWLYLTSDQLKTIIGSGHAAKQLKRQLVADGIMATTGPRDIVQRPVFQGKGNTGYKWIHAFRESLLFSRMDGP